MEKHEVLEVGYMVIWSLFGGYGCKAKYITSRTGAIFRQKSGRGFSRYFCLSFFSAFPSFPPFRTIFPYFPRRLCPHHSLEFPEFKFFHKKPLRRRENVTYNNYKSGGHHLYIIINNNNNNKNLYSAKTINKS